MRWFQRPKLPFCHLDDIGHVKVAAVDGPGFIVFNPFRFGGQTRSGHPHNKND